MPDLVKLDAVQLAQAIRSRRASCVEVMTAYLDHIDRHNPAVNAIVALQPREELLAQARERDAQLANGQVLGPMHGFPHAVKDLAPVKGIVSTRGSPIFRNFVPTADSLMVERIRNAGAILIGKTNSPEFGLGSHTYNQVYGLTRNPYDLTRSAGGSSGGAAAAGRPWRWRSGWRRSRTAATLAVACAIRRPGTMCWVSVLASGGFRPRAGMSGRRG